MPRNGSGVMSKAAGTTATPNTVIESAKYNATIDDIIQDLNTARPIVAGGTGATSAAAARTALGLTSGTAGYLFGLTLSNNTTDATNDIDIAAGIAAEQGVSSPFLMELTAAITKRLDSSWAVGTGNGGLDTGSIANTTYHVWLIQRSDTGVADVLFSTSASSPTMPTSYDRKRRIGAIIRVSAAIKRFTQVGRKVVWLGYATDLNSTNYGGGAEGFPILTVPTGINVLANFTATNFDTVGSNGGFLVTSPMAANETPNAQYNISAWVNGGAGYCTFTGELITDKTGAIRFRNNSSSATCGTFIITRGFTYLD